MIRFLRLFAAFREMEERTRLYREEDATVAASHAAEMGGVLKQWSTEVQRENAAKVQLQDRLRDLEADNLQLRRDLQESQAKTVRSTEIVADFFSQQMFGRRCFAEAFALPEASAVVEPIVRHRVQARDQVNEQTRAFYEQLANSNQQDQ